MATITLNGDSYPLSDAIAADIIDQYDLAPSRDSTFDGQPYFKGNFLDVEKDVNRRYSKAFKALGHERSHL